MRFALRQVESGSPPADVCRQLGVSEATFYIWKKKYAHLGVSELRKLRALEDENARLKRWSRICRWTNTSSPRPCDKKTRRELAGRVQTTFGINSVRSCHLAQFSRAAWYRRSSRDDQAAL